MIALALGREGSRPAGDARIVRRTHGPVPAIVRRRGRDGTMPITFGSPRHPLFMAPGLTDKDMDRIDEYLRTPVYERDPNQLLPTSDVEADAGRP